jgi:trigger factor
MAEIESTVEERGGLKRELKVRVAPERVSQAVDKAYERLRARAKVPGFRQGKVPRNILEKQYGEQVHEDVHKDLIEITCAEALREHGLDIVSAPVLVGHEHAEDGGLSYTAELEVRPTFSLQEFKGRDRFRRIARITDADVDASLQRLRERMAQLQTEEDRVNVARGDVVVFDMDASAEGKAIESATGQGLTLEVGAGASETSRNSSSA